MAWQTNRVHYGFLNRMPVEKAEVVQLEPGHMRFETIETWGRNIFLAKLRNQARSSFTARPYKEWLGVLVPLSWDGELKLNGWAANAGDVYFLDCQHDFTVACSRSTRLVFGVRRAVFNKLLAEKTGVYDTEFSFGSQLLKNCDELANVLLDTVDGLTRDAEPEALLEGARIAHDIELNLIARFVDCLLAQKKAAPDVRLSHLPSYLVVTSVRDFLFERGLADPLQLSDIYESAGVGKNKLHRSFMEVYGVSPWQFVLKYRLFKVRQALLEPQNHNMPVKDIARTYGCEPSSRFAQKYAALFKELPHETQMNSKNYMADA
jgi:AraC-like DNA-binding protein